GTPLPIEENALVVDRGTLELQLATKLVDLRSVLGSRRARRSHRLLFLHERLLFGHQDRALLLHLDALVFNRLLQLFQGLTVLTLLLSEHLEFTLLLGLHFIGFGSCMSLGNLSLQCGQAVALGGQRRAFTFELSLQLSL